MGNIDDAVPFFGKGFNQIYPLIMVIYMMLVASNFFDRVIDFFRFQNEVQEMDGYDPSGVIILQKERSWLEQGHRVGELVIPLARNFFDTNGDVESATEPVDKGTLQEEDSIESQPEALKEAIAKNPTLIKEGLSTQSTNLEPKENATSHTSLSLLNETNGKQSSGAKRISSGWQTMKASFQNFRANAGPKRFLPLRNASETSLHTVSSTELLEDIFERLKQKLNRKYMDEIDIDDDGD